MSSPNTQDWESMGLAYYKPYQKAFQAVVPRGTDCKICTAPKKTGPKPKRDQSHKAKLLRDLENSAPAFNVPIATQADSERTASIRGLAL